MARFVYQARDHAGQVVSGVLVADDPQQVIRQLRAEGKFVVKVQRNDAAELAGQETDLAACAKRVRRDDVINFAHQLAVMVDTGVGLSEALESIAEQSPNVHFRAIVADVCRYVQGGASFSSALARHPRVFPVTMTALIKASEASGTMGLMLERISQYLTKERHTLKTIRGAMTYPLAMVVISLAVTVFLLTFVLPRFASIYANRGAVLPGPTRLLLGASHVLTTYWYAFVVGLAVVVLGLLYMRTQPWGRRWLDAFKLRCPIIGPMFSQLYISRAMRTMGTMVAAGVPMLEMIHIVRQVTNNVYYHQLWDQVDQQIQHGQQLSVPLKNSVLIPPAIAVMVHAGEKAGRLGQVMERVAEFTETDFDRAVKRATEFIEPAMIMFMGSFIGFVAISLLLPIFSVGRVMAGH